MDGRCAPAPSLHGKVIETVSTGASSRMLYVLPATSETSRWYDAVIADSTYKVLSPEREAQFLEAGPIGYAVPNGEPFALDSIPCGDVYVVYLATGGKMRSARQSSVVLLRAGPGSSPLCVVINAYLRVDPCPYLPERDEAYQAAGGHSVIAEIPRGSNGLRLDRALLLPDTEYSRAWVDSLALPLGGFDAPIDERAAVNTRKRSAGKGGSVRFDDLPAGDFILLSTIRDADDRPWFRMCVALFHIAPDSVVTHVSPTLLTDKTAFGPTNGGAEPDLGDVVFYEEAPVLSYMDPPAYPDVARVAGIEGTVKVQALVDREGRIRRAVVVQSVPTLDAQAVFAVRRSEWKPALNNGKPIAVWVEIPVRFSLR